MAQEEYRRAKDVIEDINKLEANPKRKKEYSDETQKIEKRIADDKKLLDDINKKISEADSEKDFLKFSDNNVDDELLLKRQDEIFKKRKEFDDERASKQNLKEISNIKEKMEDYDIYGAEADKIHNQRKEIYQKQLDILKKHPNKDMEAQLKKQFPEFAAESQKNDAQAPKNENPTQTPKTENPNTANEKNAEKNSEKTSDAANAVSKVIKSKDGKKKEVEKLLSNDKKKSWTGKHQKELIGVGIAAVVMMALGLIIKAVSNKNKNEAAAKKDSAINAENREKRASELVSEIDREKAKEKEKDNEKNLDKDKDTDKNTLKENSSTESIKKLAESSGDSLKTADENTNKESADADKDKSKKSSAKENDGKKATGKSLAKGKTDEKSHKKPENLDGLKANKSTLKTAKSSPKTIAKKTVSTALKKKPQSRKGR